MPLPLRVSLIYWGYERTYLRLWNKAIALHTLHGLNGINSYNFFRAYAKKLDSISQSAAGSSLSLPSD